MIYFIRSPNGPIKIGTTIRIVRRLKELIAEHGPGLEVLAIADGSIQQEKQLHKRFAHLRSVGEWFEPGDDLIGFIVAEGTPWDGEPTEYERSQPVTVVNLKGTIEQREYLEKVSRKTMIPASRIVRAGIDLWMRQNGHPPFSGLEHDEDEAVTNAAIGADKPVPEPAPKARPKPAPKRTGGR